MLSSMTTTSLKPIPSVPSRHSSRIERSITSVASLIVAPLHRRWISAGNVKMGSIVEMGPKMSVTLIITQRRRQGKLDESAPRRSGGGGTGPPEQRGRSSQSLPKQKPDCTVCGRVMESTAVVRWSSDYTGIPPTRSTEVQLDHTRWQASWLMADSDAPPPSHSPEASSGWRFASDGTRTRGRLANYSGGTAPDSHRISFSARCALMVWGATNGPPAGVA